MYWETKLDAFVQAMSNRMSYNTFERILRNLHFCGNEQLDKTDKFILQVFFQRKEQSHRRIYASLLRNS